MEGKIYGGRLRLIRMEIVLRVGLAGRAVSASLSSVLDWRGGRCRRRYRQYNNIGVLRDLQKTVKPVLLDRNLPGIELSVQWWFVFLFQGNTKTV